MHGPELSGLSESPAPDFGPGEAARRLFLGLLLAAAIGAGAGCSGPEAATPAARGDGTAKPGVQKPSAGVQQATAAGLPRTIRVIGADAIAVPVNPGDAAIKAGVVSVQFAEARILAPLSRVVADVEIAGGADGALERAARAGRRWVGAELEWRSVKGGAAGGGAGSSAGGDGTRWVALVPAGAVDEATRPAAMLLDGRSVVLDWRAADAAMVEALLDIAPELSPVLTGATDALMASPDERWRAKLASGRPLGADEDAPIGDPAVAALARHEEGLWISALERVWRMDRALCLRLATRLSLAVDSIDDGAGGVGGGAGAGERVPLWPLDRATLVNMRDALVDARSSDAAARAAVGAVLLGQPAALAVVLDDGGTLAKDRSPMAAVWAAALLDEPAAAGVRLAGSAGGEELVRLEPMTARRLYVSQKRASDEEGPGPLGASLRGKAAPTTQLRVSVGDWEATRSGVTALVKAQPPGVNVGPMLVDWTMASMLEAGAERSGNAALRRAGPGLDIAGRLYREPGADGAQAVSGRGGGGGAGRWTLYLECRRGEGKLNGDTVSVYLGPAGVGAGAGGGGVMTIDVLESGELSMRVGGGERQGAGRARTAAGPERWSVWVPIPAAAIRADGILQIGLVRAVGVDGGPVARAAWPRPMLPWTDEPGRIAVDLRAWGGGGAGE